MSGRRAANSVEWPTIGLAVVLYGGWLALTFFWRAVPLALLLPLAAWTIAWHGSLQHEVLHGHPTASRAFNTALGFPPLALWLPFARYRAEHLRHHNDTRLTDPLDDPESYYTTAQDWRRLGPVGRALVRAQTTLAGRLVLGPAWLIGRFLGNEARGLWRGEPGLRRVWLLHALGVAAVLVWLEAVCGLGLGRYLLLFVYPGTALSLVRSFAEHRARHEIGHRTAIVEDAPVLGLLFLYNNLHAVHHARPRMAWYEIPRWYRAHRAEVLAANGGLVYRGYAEVFRRFLFRPHDTPVHPLEGAATRA